MTVPERHSAYRELFRDHLAPALIDEICSSTNGGFVLGSDDFQQRTAALTGRRMWRETLGRPAKVRQDDWGGDELL